MGVCLCPMEGSALSKVLLLVVCRISRPWLLLLVGRKVSLNRLILVGDWIRLTGEMTLEGMRSALMVVSCCRIFTLSPPSVMPSSSACTVKKVKLQLAQHNCIIIIVCIPTARMSEQRIGMQCHSYPLHCTVAYTHTHTPTHTHTHIHMYTNTISIIFSHATEISTRHSLHPNSKPLSFFSCSVHVCMRGLTVNWVGFGVRVHNTYKAKMHTTQCSV